jgi:hypothetical protein
VSGGYLPASHSDDPHSSSGQSDVLLAMAVFALGQVILCDLVLPPPQRHPTDASYSFASSKILLREGQTDDA